jgi:hypothetical protein
MLDVPQNSIVMNDFQMANSCVCSGEVEKWTAYEGDHISNDAREGAIGDTDVKVNTNHQVANMMRSLAVHFCVPCAEFSCTCNSTIWHTSQKMKRNVSCRYFIYTVGRCVVYQP